VINGGGEEKESGRTMKLGGGLYLSWRTILLQEPCDGRAVSYEQKTVKQHPRGSLIGETKKNEPCRMYEQRAEGKKKSHILNKRSTIVAGGEPVKPKWWGVLKPAIGGDHQKRGKS